MEHGQSNICGKPSTNEFFEQIYMHMFSLIHAHAKALEREQILYTNMLK